MNISVVCPFYNEELILDKAIERMIKNLKRLDVSWELILVNDGSNDNSFEISQKWAEKEKGLRLISYPINQGRGYALKKGINSARGEIIVTTEIDLSWGDDVVQKLYGALRTNPKMDFVVASPNLPGGGYKNVPISRIRVSKLGNKILRIFFSFNYTMHTGMTRAYRKETIQPLLLREKGKEFHIEVLLKITALGYKGFEIPAILEWRDQKLANNKKMSRKSSSKIPKLIFSHLHFAVLANPIRYFWAIAMGNFLVGFLFCCIGIFRFMYEKISIYFFLLGILLLIIGMIFFGFGIVTAQNRFVMEELWLSQIKRNNDNISI